MEKMNLNKNNHNGVKGTVNKNDYVQQVNSDRQEATAAKLSLHIGTSNVITLFMAGKFENVKVEMDRLNIDKVGICETRNGQICSENYTIYYSGGEEHARGVAIVIKKMKYKLGCWTLSDRIMMIKLKGKQFDINIVQAYAPTSASSEELTTFYEQLDMAFEICKSQKIKIVIADFNSKVGNSKHKMVVGPFGLGERNDRGETYVQWCEERDLAIMDTWFKHHKGMLFTWKRPGDQIRNQTTYVSIKDTRYKTIPSAYCNSDHILLYAKINCRLKKIKITRKEPKLDFSVLRNNSVIANQFIIEVTNRINVLEIEENHDEDPCENWNQLEKILRESANKILPK
ncbi:craniofacial development protein 2-like [Penaeus indicus]|uniref:craniofacial development protein 2-like n=1 Tax=Penaeus indicus TaxID=29960 RepID=UPI00300D5B04